MITAKTCANICIPFFLKNESFPFVILYVSREKRLDSFFSVGLVHILHDKRIQPMAEDLYRLQIWKNFSLYECKLPCTDKIYEYRMPLGLQLYADALIEHLCRADLGIIGIKLRRVH